LRAATSVIPCAEQVACDDEQRTKAHDNSVMMSSVIPSTKQSCAGSSLKLVNDKTAIADLSGIANGDASIDGTANALTAAASIRCFRRWAPSAVRGDLGGQVAFLNREA
jgi:hypothetical protein